MRPASRSLVGWARTAVWCTPTASVTSATEHRLSGAADVLVHGEAGRVRQRLRLESLAVPARSACRPLSPITVFLRSRSTQCPAASGISTSPARKRPSAPLPTLENLWVTIG